MTARASATAASAPPPPSVAQLFLGFMQLGLTGFGGVLPVARRMIVEDRRWLTPEEFTELLGLCQFLPGGNIINLSVALGMRFRGPLGALASILGLIAMPTVIVVVLGTIYDRTHDDPRVLHVFAGLAAAAAGLLISTAVKIALPLRNRPIAILVAGVTFVAIALLRLPLLPTMLAIGPLSMALVWKFQR